MGYSGSVRQSANALKDSGGFAGAVPYLALCDMTHPVCHITYFCWKARK